MVCATGYRKAAKNMLLHTCPSLSSQRIFFTPCTIIITFTVLLNLSTLRLRIGSYMNLRLFFGFSTVPNLQIKRPSSCSKFLVITLFKKQSSWRAKGANVSTSTPYPSRGQQVLGSSLCRSHPHRAFFFMMCLW